MNTRDNILHRIRTALREPSPQPEMPDEKGIFPTIPHPDLLARFERELLLLKADFHCSTNWQDAQTWCKSIMDHHEFRCVIAAPDRDVLDTCQSAQVRTLRMDSRYGKELANIDLAITTCDYLVALTGSAILTARSGFGRALSILPSAHLLVARRSQLLPNFTDAFKQLHARYGKQWPSMITIITGPSRTADIEKTLVLGAHGPKKFFVLLLDF